MAGNKPGGDKAKKKNLERHGADFYKRIGAMGGKASGKGGFASTKVGEDGLTGPQRARLVGSRGGERSRRTKTTDTAKKAA